MLWPVFAPRQLPRTLDAALRDLRDPKAHVRRSVLPDLVRLSDTPQRAEALAALVSVLGHDALPELRAQAAVALADAEATKELSALLAAANDPSEQVQQMVLLALGELSPEGHVEVARLLREAVRSPSSALRFQALLAGQRVVPGWAAEVVVRSVHDADEKVRYLALRLLDHALPAGQQVEGPALTACQRALRDDNPGVRASAALFGASRGVEGAARELVVAINDGVSFAAPQDEQDAIELVAELGLIDAIRGLRRKQRGAFGLVPGRFAWQARTALARLGDERASKEILRDLRSHRRDVRTLAVAAVGQARLSSARSELERLAQAELVDLDVLADAHRLLDGTA